MIPNPYFSKKVGNEHHLLCGSGTVPLIKSPAEDKAFSVIMADLLNQAYEHGWKQSKKPNSGPVLAERLTAEAMEEYMFSDDKEDGRDRIIGAIMKTIVKHLERED